MMHREHIRAFTPALQTEMEVQRDIKQYDKEVSWKLPDIARYQKNR